MPLIFYLASKLGEAGWLLCSVHGYVESHELLQQGGSVVENELCECLYRRGLDADDKISEHFLAHLSDGKGP